MHGLFKTVFAVLCISSVAYATPKPRNIDISIQIAEDVLVVEHDAVTTVSGDIHTAEEFSATMMFDEVFPAGNYIWADGYGNLEWSTNHYIFNQSEQNLFARNHASSPPNLLYVQDSSHSGGVEPSFKVRDSSPARSFDLHGISILPYTAAIKSPISFSIRGYPANGGDPIVRWYRWTMDAQLQYPWDAYVEGVNYVNKVEIFVVPGADTSSKERLPFTLDDVKITWRNPDGAAAAAVQEKQDVVIIENHRGTDRGL